jgi:RNA polymerase sigma-70 factor (sigma-E family)
MDRRRMDATYEEYVTHRGQALLRFAYLLCGDLHLAEDLVQEVLGRAFLHWSRVACDRPPDAYLRTALVRQYISWRRRRSSRETPMRVVPDLTGDVGDGAAGVTERDEMWRLLATLPRRQRAVLVLRYYEDLSDARIAEVLGCRVGTVRVHASRGLVSLRRAIRPSPSSVAAARNTELVGGER